MEQFEDLFNLNRSSVERFVRFRLTAMEDADDLLQEIYLTAYQKFNQLKNKDSFKPWIIRIARNKCNDYFQKKAKQLEVPLDILTERELSMNRYGLSELFNVRETLNLLGNKDQQILYLYFWLELPQLEIAKKLDIPLGTVKSRLHTAKQNFKSKYPYYTDTIKGDTNMKQLPAFLPEYKIEECDKAPFSVKWEELMGWFLVPKLNEKLSWGMYDIPSRKCSRIFDMKVIGKAMVHGIEGVELSAIETSCTNKEDVTERSFIAQLTDTHCRYLATLSSEGGIKNYITFLDGDAFMLNWGFGEDNCGNETHCFAKGDIKRTKENIISSNKDFLLDIVGRYTLTINNKTFDTVCVMDIEAYNNGVVSEQYLDKNGKTILWRRFNRNDWMIDHYNKTWEEMLPNNEQLIINGEIYVHWYDCITDYIL